MSQSFGEKDKFQKRKETLFFELPIFLPDLSGSTNFIYKEVVAMDKKDLPIIHELAYTNQGLQTFETDVREESELKEKLLLNYPTVYIVNDKEKSKKFSVYIGETSNIKRRTIEHLNTDSKKREDWEKLLLSPSSKMYVIGHHYFNKSLTLDIENKLMLYMSSVASVEAIYNRRMNQQNDYYTSVKLDNIFSNIWKNLNKKNKELFPIERIIRDSAIFKASPFHKLTDEQLRTKEFILEKVMKAINSKKTGQLILVAGEAGSGKTVLMSSLFYELNQLTPEDSENISGQDITSFLIVNHDQQLKVYEQIAIKLGIKTKKNPKGVSKPTTFISNHLPENPVDVVIVDEAHLLWTQGKQSYRGKNQLYDLLDRAKVVVAVFDIKQILTTEQYWEDSEILDVQKKAIDEENYIILNNQLRINSDQKTVRWIRSVIDDQKINTIPKDTKGYELEIFNSPEELHNAIKAKAKNKKFGISRVIANFDWEYVNARSPENDDYWRVKINNWSLPWNLQIPGVKEEKNKNLAWAEQEQTIDEVGSTFTVQGFDLNYAGVIIGPSVKYRNGKIIFEKEFSKNKKATRKRSLKDGSKKYFAETLLKNELNVLLTRGVNGLYIYAVDEELQQALLDAKKRGEIK